MKEIFEVDTDNREELLEMIKSFTKRIVELGYYPPTMILPSEPVNVNSERFVQWGSDEWLENEKIRKDLNEAERDLIKNGQAIVALKLVRERLKLTLHEASGMVLDYKRKL